MGRIEYVDGDAIAHAVRIGSPERPAVLCHVVNDAGAWGRGFTRAINGEWLSVGRAYRWWFAGNTSHLTTLAALGPEFRTSRAVNGVVEGVPFGGGRVMVLAVDDGVYVANLVAQRGLPARDNPAPLHFEWLLTTLHLAGQFARDRAADLVMPRIGCGLAGGRWADVEAVVRQVCCEHHRLTVHVCTLPGDTSWRP